MSSTERTEQTRREVGRGASASAIRHHYDLEAGFWRECLDETLTYSCALWSGDDDDLASAQRRKLAYIADIACARGQARVLDIGCGWGSMLEFLVDCADVDHAIGLTLSPSQADWIARRGDAQCEVRLESWSEHEPDQPYGAIVSIGAFEHFAKPESSRAEKVASYRAFFSRCRSWLVPGGHLGLQTIVKGDERPDREALADYRFLSAEIFPESNTPWLSEIVEASEGLFTIELASNDGFHYGRTCAEWAARLRAGREAAIAAAGEEVVRPYERYFEACVRQFSRGHAGLVRLSLRRAGRPLPILRPAASP